MKRSGHPLWSPSFISIFLMSMLVSISLYMTMPTIPRYAVATGMTLAQAGVLTGFFSIVAIFARPLAGFLSDNANKKRLLVLAYSVMGLAPLGYGLSGNIVLLYAFRVVHGVSFAVCSTVQMAVAVELVPAERTGEGLGYMGIAQIVAMSFAPNLGLYLSDSLGYQTMFFVSALLALTAGGVISVLPYHWSSKRTRPLHGKPHLRQLVAFDLLLFALMGGLFSILNSVTSSYLSLLGEERSIAGISLFFTVSSATVLLTRPFVGRIIDQKGWRVVLPTALILGGISMLFIGFAAGLWMIVVAAVFKGIGQSSGQIAVQAECVRRKPAQERGAAVSTCYLGSDLGNSFGAAYGGWASEQMGNSAMFNLVGVMLFAGIFLLLLQQWFDRRASRLQTEHNRPAEDMD